MKDIVPDFAEEYDNMDEDEKMDHAFHEMEMIYKSRCVDVPLSTNVKVVEIDKDKKEPSASEK